MIIDVGTIVTAVITGGLSLIGVIITVRQGNDRMSAELRTHQAVQDEKISNLTEEVKKHNRFAERIPVIEERINKAECRLDKLENKED